MAFIATPSIQKNGIKAVTQGVAAGEDLRAAADRDGSMLIGNAGDDILRGGRNDDVLIGGKGNDQMFGGGGADKFVFDGRQIDGVSDRDRLYDLDFGSGDTLVFGSFRAGSFGDAAGLDGYANGTSASISSFAGLAAAAAASADMVVTRFSPHNDNLLVKITNAAGQVQELLISNAWTQFVQAGGIDGL